MPVHNSDITSTLNLLADLLEIRGANEFRVRAYREAARTVDGLPRELSEMVSQEEDLSQLPGIGESMADKIVEIVHTGDLQQLNKLTKKVPEELSDLMSLPGLGPKRVRRLHEQLGIDTLEDLSAAAQDGKIQELSGFGRKTEEKLLQELKKRRDGEKRHRRTDVEQIADSLLKYLKGVDGVKQAAIAGSYRRWQETVGDLDILVTCKRGTPVTKSFTEYEDVEEVVSQGKTRSTVRLRSGIQVDLRVVPEVSYGAALHYFTGSKVHNIAVRKIGVEKGLKINEYGAFRGDDRVAGRTEEQVYQEVGLAYIEPELRESRGEIEASRQGNLPTLVTRDDIRGDLHSHTMASDGKYSLREMAEAAKELGYDYLAITDHSQHLTVAQGLDAKRLREQMQQIDQLNEELTGIRLLKGIECDILEDGTLDLEDEVLADLDLVVCSVHSKFGLSAQKQTERVIRAMDNPHLHILAHPTGRMIGRREPHELDVERAIEAALERGCFLELNAQPDRLDLNDIYCKLARDRGLKLAVSTDSHTTAALENIRYGVAQARRGWLEASDVLNTRSWADLTKLLKRN